MKSDVTPAASQTHRARHWAWQACQRVMDQRESLESVLPGLYEAGLSAEDQAFARQLLMITLRHHGQLEQLVNRYLAKKLPSKRRAVLRLLQLAAAQLCVLGTPAHAAIDTAVSLCKAGGYPHQSGLVNAVLRKISQQTPTLPAASLNLPAWLQESWRAAYGEAQMQAIARQLTQEPPLDVQLKPGVRFEVGDELLAGMRRVANQPVTAMAGYEAGDWWVQDLAASLPVRVWGAQLAGKRVLDLCAAPGGKTLQLAALGAEVIAVDRSEARMKRLRENLARTKLNAQCVVADLAEWTPDITPDYVLLDAPCSATGTIRRHPDILHQKSAQDVAEMVALQRRILTQVSRWLPASVPLLYCVCSLQPEEGEQQIDWWRAQDASLQLMPIAVRDYDWPASWQSGASVRTLPPYESARGGMDGFFIAQLMRTPLAS